MIVFAPPNFKMIFRLKTLNVIAQYLYEVNDDFQEQEFDVPPSVLSHLVQAGIVKVHPRWVIVIPVAIYILYRMD